MQNCKTNSNAATIRQFSQLFFVIIKMEIFSAIHKELFDCIMFKHVRNTVRIEIDLCIQEVSRVRHPRPILILQLLKYDKQDFERSGRRFL